MLPLTGTASAVATPAVSSIQLLPAVGPPTTVVGVHGAGFGISETVDLLFDGSELSTALTNPTGSFSGSLAAPSSALPGSHLVQSIGESTGDSATATFLVRTDWLRFHFDDANSGNNPYENVIGTANISGLTQTWTYRSGAVNGSPALVNGTLYVSGSTDVFPTKTITTALDATTGAVIWTHRTPNASAFTGVTYDRGMVFFGATDYAMHALDSSTGKKRWSFPTSGYPDTPVASGGLVYFGAGFGVVYALDERTGAPVWTYQDATSLAVGGPAVADGLVYEGDFHGRLLALDALTGVLVWDYPTGEEIDESPTVANGIVYVGSRTPDGRLGHLNAIDGATGALLWKRQLGQATYSTPAVAQGVVYVGSGVGSLNDEMHAFDAVSGTPLWTASGGDYQGSPEIANGVLYVTGGLEGGFYALDASDGTQLWSFTAGNRVADAAVIANGTVYAGSFDDNLYAFSVP